MRDEILQELRDCIVSGNASGVRSASERALKEGISPLDAIEKGMAEGLQIVGDKFQAGEYFLMELIAAGAAMEQGLKVLEPHLQEAQRHTIGKIVLGSVEGDLHSIGKDIVCMLLRGAGFEVIDLGVDVPNSRVVETVRAENPQILGLSALITSTMPQMGNVIRQLKDANLREQTKVIVGGAPLSDEFATKISADAFAPNAAKGVSICKEWIERSAHE